MNYSIVAMWGKAVGYSDYHGNVMIETVDGRVAVVREDLFNQLYYKLDMFTAALKEDCIEYTVHHKDQPILSYPEWYINAIQDGWIVRDDYGGYTFYDYKSGEIPMSPVSIVLRNYMGELMYMEPEQFDKFYDTVGE